MDIKFRDLEKMTDAEIIKRLDRIMETLTPNSYNFWIDELNRRRNDRAARKMLTIAVISIAIAVLALIVALVTGLPDTMTVLDWLQKNSGK